MGKLRVQDVAKELGVPVKEVREVLKGWGIDKGNFAYLDDEELQIVYDHFSVSKEKVVENGGITTEVREETIKVSEPPREEKQAPQKEKEEKKYRDQKQRDYRPYEQKARQPAREAPLAK
ncbi:MAG: translation initiation factor IF-2, partial [Aquificota bacterium]